MPTLARIRLHPVKSFDALAVDEAVMLPSGALEFDRRYALRDAEGNLMNGKRSAAMHRLRSQFDVPSRVLSLRIDGDGLARAFHVDKQRPELSAWLSAYFQTPLEWIENPAAGFPDDTESPGPTLVSTATLTEVASWFAGLSVDDVRNRFRANLEIDGVEAFWEDRLVAGVHGEVRFQLGPAVLLGTNPCQRCVVPSRDAQTGEVTPQFAKTFARKRQETLPAWAPRDRFDHFYRLTVNTRAVSDSGAVLRVGDKLEVLSGA